MKIQIVDGVDFTEPLTTAEVAAIFRVAPNTVTRWATTGQLASVRTPGGHRRFSRAQVQELLRGDAE